ncbi:Asp-tRNA(Asn)/Glu-tRNA(Gln) amidotransferase GatCAB subunit C [candidate division GN15 bacterium]|uniref:Aspartyl/glutamyl-tRNA(Asn/Gln) amidotransferase subunit C n=1 Tax=candidate division GN15 bacterium TaxID=2072418 RepID=A0A855X602_9BACT|nr:MAG: Asp-tRNA(Asn)/Glu-tRNA(Gln) amidotransferase GatCAB subunit C [candidate division GN15 bacterium]
MPLTTQQVEHIARLAKLNLTPEEIKKFTVELTVVLDYIDQLKTVETRDVGPTDRIGSGESRLRDDVAEPSLPAEEVLKLAPRHTQEFILVPKVLG